MLGQQEDSDFEGKAVIIPFEVYSNSIEGLCLNVCGCTRFSILLSTIHDKLNLEDILA